MAIRKLIPYQARSCLYASMQVGTHHFPLGLCPTPNWSLNYDSLPYFAYTSFPGWLRPCLYLKPYCDPSPNSRDSSLNKLGSTIYLIEQHAYKMK